MFLPNFYDRLLSNPEESDCQHFALSFPEKRGEYLSASSVGGYGIWTNSAIKKEI